MLERMMDTNATLFLLGNSHTSERLCLALLHRSALCQLDVVNLIEMLCPGHGRLRNGRPQHRRRHLEHQEAPVDHPQ